MKSYVRVRLGPLGRAGELYSLYRRHTDQLERRVTAFLDEARDIRAKLERATGRRPLESADVLEIGAGQQFVQLSYFAASNRAVGIDTDFVPLDRSPLQYLHMWRANGTLRTVKTATRQALGIDARVRDHLRRHLRADALPRPRVLQMDAADMTFPDASFDAVYSRAVFEHLPDPAAVLRQVRRILRPGGAAVIILHLYTSDSGCHDGRIFANRRGDLPFWSHLRPQFRPRVRENTYLNRLRLADWRAIFDAELPGSALTARCDAPDDARAALPSIRAAGELDTFTDEELLSNTLDAIWTKPRT